MRPLSFALLALSLTALLPSSSDAFCGFYVAGSGERLMNEATQVALMREGTRTVLSMRNNYRGPLQNFAMVVPVPVVLQQENVRTLEHALFDRLEAYSAPRLVEYWEQDPCVLPHPELQAVGALPRPSPRRRAAGRAAEEDLGVTIEAQFAVGEYEIVILSATQSAGLETWLNREHYTVPQGAAAALAPYIREGWKFFAAKVNIDRVQRRPDGSVQLSPLRFHYDSTEFRLPVRLGLLNAGAQQDLVVYILNPTSRFEVANYPNAFIPTNLDVSDTVRANFGAFYAELFDRTVQRNGGRAVVTEYAWQSTNCDPCAGPPLNAVDLASLGGDVRPPPPPPQNDPLRGLDLKPGDGVFSQRFGRGRRWWGGPSWVVTRLHARYSAATLTEDLVFREAPPATGGREFMTGPNGLLETAQVGSGVNNFQARYAIRHPWTGPINCPNPLRGRWGGPPSGGGPAAAPATDLAFARRGAVALASSILTPVPELSIAGVPDFPSGIASRAATQRTAPPTPPPTPPPVAATTPTPNAGRCVCSTPGHRSSAKGSLWGIVAGLALFARRSKKRRQNAAK